MNAITSERLYELFVDTAQRCSSSVAVQSDEEFEYNLFEEFDAGVRSFFHDDSLKTLSESGMITQEVVAISRLIRSKWIELNVSDWTRDQINGHPEWKWLFKECDRLLSLLEQRREFEDRHPGL
jgi:hypothetical protein